MTSPNPRPPSSGTSRSADPTSGFPEAIGDDRVPCMLIVDDDEISRFTLATVFARENVSVAFAASGPEAFEYLAQNPVDVVLLDVMMPGMDGFEVCKRLKDDPALAPIPVLLVTSLDSPKDVLRGLKAGAEEFISKPVNRSELRARVRSMLRIKRHYDEMRELGERMVQLHRQREVMTSFLVHDFKNPLSVISMNAQVCAMRALPPEVRSCIDDIAAAAQLLDRMVLDMLDVARSEEQTLAPQRAPVDLGAVAREAADREKNRAVERGAEIVVTVDGDARLDADASLLRRLLGNLLDNAIKYGPFGRPIGVDVAARGGAVELRVRDEGAGIPVYAREHVFDRYARHESGGRDHDRRSRGLGLAFCKVAAESHGGRIWIEENVPRGTVFCVSLPRVAP